MSVLAAGLERLRRDYERERDGFVRAHGKGVAVARAYRTVLALVAVAEAAEALSSSRVQNPSEERIALRATLATLARALGPEPR